MSFDFSPKALRKRDPELALELETANLVIELETITDYEWALLGSTINPRISIKLGPSRALVLAPSSRSGSSLPTWGPFQHNSETGGMVQMLQVNASIQESTHISMMFSVEAFSIRAVITKVVLAISD